MWKEMKTNNWEKNVWKKRFRIKFCEKKRRKKIENKKVLWEQNCERKKNWDNFFKIFVFILYTISKKCYCSTLCGFLLVEKNVRKRIEEKIVRKKMWGQQIVRKKLRKKCVKKMEKYVFSKGHFEKKRGKDIIYLPYPRVYKHCAYIQKSAVKWPPSK